MLDGRQRLSACTIRVVDKLESGKRRRSCGGHGAFVGGGHERRTGVLRLGLVLGYRRVLCVCKPTAPSVSRPRAPDHVSGTCARKAHRKKEETQKKRKENTRTKLPLPRTPAQNTRYAERTTVVQTLGVGSSRSLHDTRYSMYYTTANRGPKSNGELFNRRRKGEMVHTGFLQNSVSAPLLTARTCFLHHIRRRTT